MARARRPADRWALPLEERLQTKDGRELVTIGDARAYVLALEQRYQLRQHWQHAAALLLEASASGRAREATHQVRLALFLDCRLVLDPPAPAIAAGL